jgi:hypothetical protein
MALIVEYHVIADMYTVGTQDIKAGMLVSLVDGKVVPTPIADSAKKAVLGIAGDSAVDSGQTTAYSASIVLGAGGNGTRYTSNRVSDFYDETAASQKVTVYNGGGKFWISSDLFDVASEINSGDLLRPSAATKGLWDNGVTVTNNNEVALAVGASQAYSSGVPGVDIDGSMTLGNYIPVILRV